MILAITFGVGFILGMYISTQIENKLKQKKDD
jgi:uncharacterized protein YneF (UPF0154 family)